MPVSRMGTVAGRRRHRRRGEDIPDAPNPPLVLVYSTSRSRANPVPLHGASVSGAIYVHLTNSEVQIARVQFFLDPAPGLILPDQSAETAEPSFIRGDANPPLDMMGGNAYDPAIATSGSQPWLTTTDPSAIGGRAGYNTDGSHTLAVRVTYVDGSVARFDATFTTNNAGGPRPVTIPVTVTVPTPTISAAAPQTVTATTVTPTVTVPLPIVTVTGGPVIVRPTVIARTVVVPTPTVTTAAASAASRVGPGCSGSSITRRRTARPTPISRSRGTTRTSAGTNRRTRRTSSPGRRSTPRRCGIRTRTSRSRTRSVHVSRCRCRCRGWRRTNISAQRKPEGGLLVNRNNYVSYIGLRDTARGAYNETVYATGRPADREPDDRRPGPRIVDGPVHHPPRSRAQHSGVPLVLRRRCATDRHHPEHSR